MSFLASTCSTVCGAIWKQKRGKHRQQKHKYADHNLKYARNRRRDYLGRRPNPQGWAQSASRLQGCAEQAPALWFCIPDGRRPAESLQALHNQRIRKEKRQTADGTMVRVNVGNRQNVR